MPYYLETDDRKLLEQLKRLNVCAECGSELYAYYDFDKHLPYLACSRVIGHQGIAREYREPRELNIPAWREKMEKEYGQEKGKELARYHPAETKLNQAQAMHILKLVYPNAPEDEIMRCAILCRDFGLHPLKKEVYLIPFLNKKTGKKEWSTVVGIAADRKIAATQKGAYSFLDDTPRAASKDEVIKQFGENSEETEKNLISICKVQGESGNQSIGFGLWSKGNDPYGTDKGNTKRNMANIRAERQAVSRLPGRPLPQVEVIDEAYAEVPEIGTVDTTTGEVIEASEAENKPEATPEAPEKATSTPEVIPPENTKPDLSTLEFKNAGEFKAAALKHFNLQGSQVDKEVPEYDLTNAGQRKKAWQQIVGAYSK